MEVEWDTRYAVRKFQNIQDTEAELSSSSRESTTYDYMKQNTLDLNDTWGSHFRHFPPAFQWVVLYYTEDGRRNLASNF